MCLQLFLNRKNSYAAASYGYTSSCVSTEKGDRSRVYYTVLVFTQATQANSAWSSLRG